MILKNDYLKFNCQALNSTYQTICVVNVQLLYLNNDGKLDIYYKFKEIIFHLKMHQLFF